jgi:hypothetical protein
MAENVMPVGREKQPNMDIIARQRQVRAPEDPKNEQ